MKTIFSGYIFDLDGTIYVGDQLIDGADQVIEELQSAGKRVLFLTNKTIVSREDYVKKLNRLGIHVGIEHILSANAFNDTVPARASPWSQVICDR